MPRHRHGRRGSSLVEFALTLPIFLGMATAIVDFGLYFAQESVITEATREGARAGSLAGTGHAAAAQSTTDTVLAASGIADAEVGATVAGDLLTIHIAAPFEPLFGLVATPEEVGATLITRVQHLEEN